VCKEVAPKRRKTAPPAIAVIAKTAKIPTNRPPAANAAVEAVHSAVIAAVSAAAPAMATAKASPRARPSDKLHIHIIQYAARAIF